MSKIKILLPKRTPNIGNDLEININECLKEENFDPEDIKGIQLEWDESMCTPYIFVIDRKNS